MSSESIILWDIHDESYPSVSEFVIGIIYSLVYSSLSLLQGTVFFVIK